jgi:hypothetical protein
MSSTVPLTTALDAYPEIPMAGHTGTGMLSARRPAERFLRVGGRGDETTADQYAENWSAFVKREGKGV